MTDLDIRKSGRAGRITLTRPEALNALSHDMCLTIEAALDSWQYDDEVALVIVDAAGDKAFCAGGDLHRLYQTGRSGDVGYGHRFWTDEYRLNAKIAEYPKPYVAFMQGYTMGGGVGLACHGTHRIVGESSRIALPECSIGLVPDVGGTLLLAQAPGRMGEYLGLTGAKINAADAIAAGFADFFVPIAQWPDLVAALEKTGDQRIIEEATETPPPGPLICLRPQVDSYFGGEALIDILNALRSGKDEFATRTLDILKAQSPLSMACTVEMIHRMRRPYCTIRDALELEYRFTRRAMAQGDFLEGIRAAVIDKDRRPNWQHDLAPPPALAATRMLMPLGPQKLQLDAKG